MTRTRWLAVFLISVLATGLVAGVIGAKLQTIRMQRADTASPENRLESFRLSQFSNVGVAMVGDSLIANAAWNELLGCKNLINRGIGSETSIDVLQRLDEVLDRKPKIVALMVGANNVSTRVPASESMAAMKETVDRARRSGATMIVHLLLPVAKGYMRPDMNSGIASLNASIEQAFGSRDGVTLLDMRPALSTPDGFLRSELTTDGIHLNVAGYKIWRDALAPKLSDACQ